MVTHIEAARRSVGALDLMALARAYGVPLAEFDVSVPQPMVVLVCGLRCWPCVFDECASCNGRASTDGVDEGPCTCSCRVAAVGSVPAEG